MTTFIAQIDRESLRGKDKGCKCCAQVFNDLKLFGKIRGKKMRRLILFRWRFAPFRWGWRHHAKPGRWRMRAK
ncbi:MAG: hypothetical protein ACREAB_13335 [Blastocatellia bacterium]